VQVIIFRLSEIMLTSQHFTLRLIVIWSITLKEYIVVYQVINLEAKKNVYSKIKKVKVKLREDMLNLYNELLK